MNKTGSQIENYPGLGGKRQGHEIRDGQPLQLVMGQRQPGDVNKPYWVRYVKTIRID